VTLFQQTSDMSRWVAKMRLLGRTAINGSWPERETAARSEMSLTSQKIERLGQSPITFCLTADDAVRMTADCGSARLVFRLADGAGTWDWAVSRLNELTHASKGVTVV
jgi:hypothetical protein